jgi:hypothetical protein
MTTNFPTKDVEQTSEKPNTRSYQTKKHTLTEPEEYYPPLKKAQKVAFVYEPKTFTGTTGLFPPAFVQAPEMTVFDTKAINVPPCKIANPYKTTEKTEKTFLQDPPRRTYTIQEMLELTNCNSESELIPSADYELFSSQAQQKYQAEIDALEDEDPNEPDVHNITLENSFEIIQAAATNEKVAKAATTAEKSENVAKATITTEKNENVAKATTTKNDNVTKAATTTKNENVATAATTTTKTPQISETNTATSTKTKQHDAFSPISKNSSPHAPSSTSKKATFDTIRRTLAFESMQTTRPHLTNIKFHDLQPPYNPTQDPLSAVMSQPQLISLQDLIKDLADAATKASKSVKSKKAAIKKLEDPTNTTGPRSVRNNFTLTTIAEFTGHPEYKELVIEAEAHVSQYKENITGIITKLANKELQWLKHHKVQLITPIIAKINKSLLFRAKRILGERPAAFNKWIITETTLPFLVLYWLMTEEHHHSQIVERPNNFETFFEMPYKEIATIAAYTMIDGPPTLAAKVLHQIANTENCDWDILDLPTSYFMNLILPDLNEIITAALFANISIKEQQEQQAQIEAETLAFVRKLRTETATNITQEALNNAAKRINNDSVERRALNIRTTELEKNLTQTRELLHTVIKQDHRQKNYTGRVLHPQATRRPEQKKGTHTRHPPAIGHPRFQPAQKQTPPTKTQLQHQPRETNHSHQYTRHPGRYQKK